MRLSREIVEHPQRLTELRAHDEGAQEECTRGSNILPRDPHPFSPLYTFVPLKRDLHVVGHFHTKIFQAEFIRGKLAIIDSRMYEKQCSLHARPEINRTTKTFAQNQAQWFEHR